LELLKGLTKLTHLNLIYAKKITAASIAHLAGMTELQSLNLVHIPLGKGGMKPLAQMTRLTELHLEDCKLLESPSKPPVDAHPGKFSYFTTSMFVSGSAF
jgi:hypothetical protein